MTVRESTRTVKRTKTRLESRAHANQAVHELFEQAELRDQLLNDLGERFEDRVIVDGTAAVQAQDSVFGS